MERVRWIVGLSVLALLVGWAPPVAQAAGRRLVVTYPRASVVGHTVVVSGTVSKAYRHATRLVLERRVSKAWKRAAATRPNDRGRFRLSYLPAANATRVSLRVRLLRAGRTIAVSRKTLRLIHPASTAVTAPAPASASPVSPPPIVPPADDPIVVHGDEATASPTRMTTLEAPGGFALTVPAGTVASPTPIRISTLDDPSGDPAADFAIDGSWADGQRKVTVTLPISPSVALAGAGWQPALLHTHDGRTDIIKDADVHFDPAAGRVSADLTSLSPIVSTALGPAEYLSGPTVESSAVTSARTFLGRRVAQPTCPRPGDTSRGSSDGSAFVPHSYFGGEPAIKKCLANRGSLTWTLANNTGVVLQMSTVGNVVFKGVGPSGNPVVDQQFTATHSSHYALVPPGGSVDVALNGSLIGAVSGAVRMSEDAKSTEFAWALGNIFEALPDEDVKLLEQALVSCSIDPRDGFDASRITGCVRTVGGALAASAPKVARIAEKAAKLALGLDFFEQQAAAIYNASSTPLSAGFYASGFGGSGGGGGGGGGGGAGGLPQTPAVSTGPFHSCALRSSGTVACWGQGLANGSESTSSTAVTVSGIDDAVFVAGHGNNTCALRRGGSVSCWGVNDQGQLGNGTTTDSVAPTSVTGIKDAVAVAGGGDHACAVRANGAVLCWGSNFNRQLGDGTRTDAHVPVSVEGLSDAVALSLGQDNSCALEADGRVACWGANIANQGSGDAGTPVRVAGLSAVKAISTGSYHQCAIEADGTARCWGDNSFGQIGDGTHTFAAAPVVVGGVTDAVALAAGATSTCALRGTGGVLCWGRNNVGQLGNGSTRDSSVPVVVRGLTDAVAIDVSTAGGDEHVCAMRSSGAVVCWGNEYDGELGDGQGPHFSTVPVAVKGF